jgi:hypothetical protein
MVISSASGGVWAAGRNNGLNRREKMKISFSQQYVAMRSIEMSGQLKRRQWRLCNLAKGGMVSRENNKASATMTEMAA